MGERGKTLSGVLANVLRRSACGAALGDARKLAFHFQSSSSLAPNSHLNCRRRNPANRPALPPSPKLAGIHYRVSAARRVTVRQLGICHSRPLATSGGPPTHSNQAARSLFMIGQASTSRLARLRYKARIERSDKLNSPSARRRAYFACSEK